MRGRLHGSSQSTWAPTSYGPHGSSGTKSSGFCLLYSPFRRFPMPYGTIESEHRTGQRDASFSLDIRWDHGLVQYRFLSAGSQNFALLRSFRAIASFRTAGRVPVHTRIYPGMYRDRLWTMRQYAGFGSASESNQRYKFLLSQGITGLSVAFDLPTQMGMDSDHPLAAGKWAASASQSIRWPTWSAI